MLISDYGVKDDEQFSHTGGEDDFEGFSLVFEEFCEMTNDRVAASCRQSGHIEGGANLFSATGDVGGTGLFSGFTVIGSQAGQGGDLVAVEPAQFGQVREEHGAGLGPDAGDALQEAVFVLEVFVGLDMVADEVVEFADLVIESFDHFADALTDLGMMDHLRTIDFLGMQIGELFSSGDQLGEGFGWGVFRRPGYRVNHFAKAGQEVGVDGIGFGNRTEALGEFADLSGIGDNDVVSGLHEFGGEGFFVAAGGLHDDLCDGEALEGVEEVAAALLGMEPGAVQMGRAGSDLKRVLGDVYADEKGLRHGTHPFLPMRARRWNVRPAQAAVRTSSSTGAARTTLRDGLGDPGTTGLTSPWAAASARYARLVSRPLSYGTNNHVGSQHTRTPRTRRKMKIFVRR